MLGIIKLVNPGGLLLEDEHQSNLASNREKVSLLREPGASGN